MTTPTGNVALADVDQIIKDQLRFQKRWQLLSMALYVGLTVGTLVTTSAAGLLAAMHHDQAAAILAATATVLVGVEKTLLFREKWKFHLAIRTKFELLRTTIITQGLPAAEAGKKLAEIMEAYATNLPVEARGQ